MKNPLVLANIDYRTHTTNEGDELQGGLNAAGWILAGYGFANHFTHVPTILDTFKPDVVFVSDKRDWDKRNPGCFNHAVSCEEVGVLCKEPQIFKLAVVKDAGSSIEYHKHFCEEIGANSVVTYYHDDSILGLSPWLKNYSRVRTYHSVDAAFIAGIDLRSPRKNTIVSGALSSVYPVRQKVFDNAKKIGCDVIAHPGYSNRRSFTPDYLQMISKYKVHIATASEFGFALRKIIESVAVGATPITDLPAYDILPEIDGALVRISPKASVGQITETVQQTLKEWDIEERMHYAKLAQRWYDWRRIGLRLTNLIADQEKNFRGR